MKSGTWFLVMLGLIAIVFVPEAVAQPLSQDVSAASEPLSVVARLSAWIKGLGAGAYVLAPLFMIVVAILPIPAEIPAMLNGMLFGPVIGVMITWGGALVGACISFELARRVGRPLAARFVAKHGMERVDRVVEASGWQGLFVVRLIPTIAFTPESTSRFNSDRAV